MTKWDYTKIKYIEIAQSSNKNLNKEYKKI